MVTEVFPPEEGETLRELTRQRPDLHGFSRSRWRLADLREALPWLKNYSLPGVCKALQRLNVKRKQGRLHVHSPDPAYLLKLKWIASARQLASAHPEQVSVLYADELSFYRRPSLCAGGVYYPEGRKEEPIFNIGAGYNTRHRVGAAIDMHSGRVVWVDGAVVGVEALCLLLDKVRQTYPAQGGPQQTEGERALFLIWDNWPVHYHEKVLSKASELNIHLLWLPTYAPWTNPIEKMWRYLKQEHLHNHQLAEQFAVLKDRVRAFLDNFAGGSAHLLRYCGLAAPITSLSC